MSTLTFVDTQNMVAFLDRMQLHELMNLCTKLSDRVLTLETTKTIQALEIASLKSRVKQLEKKANKRTYKFKRLYRVGSTRRVESSNDEGLGAQEDASKHGRSIEDIDKDVEVSLVDETQGRSDDVEMFDTYALIGDEVFAQNDMTEKEHDVIPKEVSVAETLTTAGIKISVSTAAPSTTAVTLPVITESTVTTAPSTIPKAKCITFRDAGETTTRTPTSVSSSSIKDKGKAKMIETKVPLNKKDQIMLDKELARRLDAKVQKQQGLKERMGKSQGDGLLKKVKIIYGTNDERKRDTLLRSGYHQKDRKPKPNDQNEHGMEKDGAKSRPKSKNAKRTKHVTFQTLFITEFRLKNEMKREEKDGWAFVAPSILYGLNRATLIVPFPILRQIPPPFPTVSHAKPLSLVHSQLNPSLFPTQPHTTNPAILAISKRATSWGDV
ncbi:hypothetical protein Tco_0503525 [Tanacetum coccineum]